MPSADGKMRLTDMANTETLLHLIQSIKGLKTHNLRDHQSEAELIFTVLAELSTIKRCTATYVT